jgi:predicted nucleotidyltransferase
MMTSQPIALLAERRDGISDLCRRFGVERLEVFGSAGAGDFIPGKSDVDLLVRFVDTSKPGYVDRSSALPKHWRRHWDAESTC